MSEEVDDFEEFINPYHKIVLAAIKSIGWYVIGVCIILIYTWPFINKKLSSWKKKRDDKEYDAKYHKNVELSTELLIGTQLARERMQEKFLKDRDIARLKEEERKEKKRQELLRLQNNTSSGYRLNGDVSKINEQSTSSKSSKSKFQGDYNPLMGNGGGGRYVPSKRSRCGNGGCG